MTDDRQVTVQADHVSVEYRVRPTEGRRGTRALTGMMSRRPVVHALTDVCVQLHAGETVGLVGGNGAGKSTLLRTLTGLTPPTTGSVLASSRPLLLSVGAALIPELSGRRNAYLGALAMGLGKDAASEAVSDVLSFAGLGEAAERPLATYSSGMAARLRFAIATYTPREILFVDEALSVGDAAFARKARERMAAMSEAAGTVVLVSHTPAQLLETCTRGLWLDRGVIRADGPIEAVLEEYRRSEG